MPTKDILRYGLYYALIYVGVLGLIFIGVAIVASFYEFRSPNVDIGALLTAAPFTYLRFLNDKVRLPTSREYWSLVAVGSIIVLVVDFSVAALVIHLTRDYGLDRTMGLTMIAFSLFKGVLGTMLFFRSGGFGKRSLVQIEAKQARLDPPSEPPTSRMTFDDIGSLLVRYFAVYIPLFVVTRYVSITSNITGGAWLSSAIMLIAALCALAFVVRRLGRRPTLSEYGLLVLATVISGVVFEFVAATAIYLFRYGEMPNIRPVLSYMSGFAITSAVIHAIAYSRPGAWLVRPRTRPV